MGYLKFGVVMCCGGDAGKGGSGSRERIGRNLVKSSIGATLRVVEN